MKLDIGTLRTFSAALLKLVDIAAQAPPERMIDDALHALRPLVPFRSAWWGECSQADAHLPRRNWLHGRINLDAAFAREWNALAERDRFAGASMQQLGVVMRSSGHQDPHAEVEAFSRRHDLFHVMAITVELSGSGLMFFVALYRGADEAAFDDVADALFAEFSAHLVLHWRQRMRELLRGAQARASDAFALADAHGNLLYLGSRIGRLLHRQHAQWSGSTLPVELAASLAQLPCSVALGSERLTMQACGELVALVLERGGRTAALPPRERSAAMLYAQGHSYKEIARLLGLSPATVRTYLRSAYLQLGVRNKVELGGALSRS